MNNITHSLNVSIGVGVSIALTIATMLLISVPQAKAFESPDILIGQDLSLGSTGQGVVVLQGLMSELGYLSLPASVPLGYFGELTRDAVARYQISKNISPSAGYYGSITKTIMHSDFASHGWLALLDW